MVSHNGYKRLIAKDTGARVDATIVAPEIETSTRSLWNRVIPKLRTH
jgi:hypothetical protein